jgi:hypothetical protein
MRTTTATAKLESTGQVLGQYQYTSLDPVSDRELAKWSIKLATQFRVCVSDVVVTKTMEER